MEIGLLFPAFIATKIFCWCSSDTNGNIKPSPFPRHPPSAAPLFSLFLLIFLSLTPRSLPLPSSPSSPSSPVLDVFSPQQRRKFPYRITTRIRWPGFDSSSKPCAENENLFMCIWSSTSHRCEPFLPGENIVRLQCVIVDNPTGYFV